MKSSTSWMQKDKGGTDMGDQEKKGYCQLNMLQAKGNGFTERCHHPSCTHRFLPNLERLGAQNPIVNRLHEVAAKAKEILSESMQRQKPLRL